MSDSPGYEGGWGTLSPPASPLPAAAAAAAAPRQVDHGEHAPLAAFWVDPRAPDAEGKSKSKLDWIHVEAITKAIREQGGDEPPRAVQLHGAPEGSSPLVQLGLRASNPLLTPLTKFGQKDQWTAGMTGGQRGIHGYFPYGANKSLVEWTLEGLEQEWVAQGLEQSPPRTLDECCITDLGCGYCM